MLVTNECKQLQSSLRTEPQWFVCAWTEPRWLHLTFCDWCSKQQTKLLFSICMFVCTYYSQVSFRYTVQHCWVTVLYDVRWICCRVFSQLSPRVSEMCYYFIKMLIFVLVLRPWVLISILGVWVVIIVKNLNSLKRLVSTTVPASLH